MNYLNDVIFGALVALLGFFAAITIWRILDNRKYSKADKFKKLGDIRVSPMEEKEVLKSLQTNASKPRPFRSMQEAMDADVEASKDMWRSGNPRTKDTDQIVHANQMRRDMGLPEPKSETNVDWKLRYEETLELSGRLSNELVDARRDLRTASSTVKKLSREKHDLRSRLQRREQSPTVNVILNEQFLELQEQLERCQNLVVERDRSIRQLRTLLDYKDGKIAELEEQLEQSIQSHKNVLEQLGHANDLVQDKVRELRRTKAELRRAREDQHPSGPYTDIGPECFADAENNVICYKGENFYRACDRFVSERSNGEQTFCIKRAGHTGLHEAWDGATNG